MSYQVKAIETTYKGYRFRSRLEARWAVFFDTAGIEWRYEEEGFELPSGERYLPDFWLPYYQSFAEVKPGKTSSLKTVYLAGKMTDWRDEFMRHCCCNNPYMQAKCSHDYHIFHPLPSSDDPTEIGRVVVTESLIAIKRADIVFAYLSSKDCFGTLCEIGYACASGKKIFVAIDSSTIGLESTGGHGFYIADELGSVTVDCVGHNCQDSIQESDAPRTLTVKGELGELWFSACMADRYSVVGGADGALRFFKQCVPPDIEPDERKSSELAAATKRPVIMLRDIPENSGQFKTFTQDGIRLTRWSNEEAFRSARSARFEFGQSGGRI